MLVNFTGYACTNCHWMKANMFPRPEIQSALQDLIIVDLYTDGTDCGIREEPEARGSEVLDGSIPFYALMDAIKT